MTIQSFDQFVPLAVRTESKFDAVRFNKSAFEEIVAAYIAAGNLMDILKKSVAYNKPINLETFHEHARVLRDAGTYLNEEESIELDRKEVINVNTRLFHGIVGIATEGTELVEAMQKAINNDGNWDGVNLLEEVGDIAWYEAILLDELGADFYPVITRIIEKLQARYPEKYFTSEAAINRDLDTERKILEG